MENGKIACCRINYDDYVNFEIDLLTDEEIKQYEIKYLTETSFNIKERLDKIKNVKLAEMLDYLNTMIDLIGKKN